MACAAARRRLRRHGVEFDEIHGDEIPDFRHFLRESTCGPTVPQILIDSEPIGGSDDLAALDRSGALTPRLRREPFPAVVVKRRFPAFLKRYRLRIVSRDGTILEATTASSKEEAERAAEDLKKRCLAWTD